jgi:hypothetical protein
MSTECLHTVQSTSRICWLHKTCLPSATSYSSVLHTICLPPPPRNSDSPLPRGPASVGYWLTCLPAMISADQSRVAVKRFGEGLRGDVTFCGRSSNRPRNQVEVHEYHSWPLPDQVSSLGLPYIQHSNAWQLTALVYLYEKHGNWGAEPGRETL